MRGRIDTKLLDAAVAVLADHGFEGLSLERVATRLGGSRVTLWRQGVTRETLVAAMLERLRLEYRDAMWPVLTSPGTGRDRLERALKALCDVVDRNLALLSVSDSIVHRASKVRASASIGFNEAFVRVLAEGASDGSLRVEGSVDDAANVLFNTVCWSYVHLRGRHKWSASRSRPLIFDLVLRGLVSAEPANS